jgi:hypothetical protein
MKNIFQSLSMGRALKWSGFLVSTGLIVQLLCLVRIHPFSFIAFLGIGCPLVGAGIVLYLFSILTQSDKPQA